MEYGVIGDRPRFFYGLVAGCVKGVALMAHPFSAFIRGRDRRDRYNAYNLDVLRHHYPNVFL